MTSRLRAWPERSKSWCQSLALLVLEPECCWKWDLSQRRYGLISTAETVFTSWLRENISALWYFYGIKYSIKLCWEFSSAACRHWWTGVTSALCLLLQSSYWLSDGSAEVDQQSIKTGEALLQRFNLKLSIFIRPLWVLRRYKSPF